jgi:tetratricopeptide (TPR) repeat protein
MRRKRELFFRLGWLAAFALLASRAVAAEQASIQSTIVRGESSLLSPRLSELERRLFDKTHDGRFGDFSLLEAGLIAGGVDQPGELRRYVARFDALVEALRRSGQVRGEPRKQAQTLFTFLHQSILTGGYHLQASDVRQAFDSGRFNCVTATLLFNSLAARFGLKVVAVEQPGHAMSRLALPGETLDIETTCPRWRVESGTLRAPPDSGTRSVPDTPRQISDVQLVATIYYNRGVDSLLEKKFEEAIAANAKGLRLDPENATTKANYLATINNWAIALGTSGEFEKAAELLRLGEAIDPRCETFRTNYVQVFRQWSDRLCRSGHYDDAVRLLTHAAEEQPGDKFFHEAAIEILRRRANLTTGQE